MDLFEPDTVVERYVIERHIDTGGIFHTYQARHVDLLTRHRLMVPALHGPELFERILQAARLQARLRHRHLVGVTDVVWIETVPCVVEEYVEGVNLRNLIERRTLTLDEIDHLGRGILHAVAWLHDNGVIHRDVKAAQFTVDLSGASPVPRLANLALARELARNEVGTGLRDDGTPLVVGTPWFMSPEQTRDTPRVDQRADLWSVGCLLYLLICRVFPFAYELVPEGVPDRQTIDNVFAQVRDGAYRPVEAHRADIPDRMVRAIAASLEVDLDRRVADAKSLLAIWTSDTEDPEVASERPPSGRATLVFTDVEGSTVLWNEAGVAMRHALLAHDAIMRRVLRENGGYEVKTEGDAFMIAFAHPADALRFCVEAQHALHGHAWSKDLLAHPLAADGPAVRGLRVRMGMHTGIVENRVDPITGRVDYYGPTVNEAARVSGAGSGGQIVASDVAWAEGQEGATGAIGQPLGRYLLKGFATPRELVEVRAVALPHRQMPPPRLPRADEDKTPTPLAP